MNVLFVSAYGAWGRPASYIKSQSDSLKKIGMNVTDFYFKGRGIAGYIKSYFELLKFLKANKNFDLIHAHFGYTAFFVYLAFYKSKLVISFMGDDLYGIVDENNKQTIKGKLNIAMSAFLQKKADWIIVKSGRMLEYIKPVFRNISTVVPNGVDFQKFPLVDQAVAKQGLGLAADKKYILFLGSKEEKRKNYKLLQEAYDSLNLPDTVLLNPYPIKGEEVNLFLNAADVLVLVSTLEGSPNVIKEALVCNCPIVSTDVGDVAERIKNVKGCYLTKFDVEDLKEKIVEALNFNSRTNGRALSEYLKSDKVALQIENIYYKASEKVQQLSVNASRVQD